MNQKYHHIPPNRLELRTRKHLQADSEGTSACRQLACSYGGVTVLEKNTIDQGACTDSEGSLSLAPSGKPYSYTSFIQKSGNAKNLVPGGDAVDKGIFLQVYWVLF